MKMGLYGNIAAKKARIKAGSGEKMRKPGTKGAPTAAAFKAAAKTAKGKKK
jgi:cysteine sulfinate desulfinase/cysteine desulfurase-like protein